MTNRLLLLAAALLVACTPRASREQAAASTYMIEVDVTTAPSEMFDAPGATEGHMRWRGTAWVAQYDRDGRARLVTAGHVCESRSEIELDFMGIPLGSLEVRRVDYKLVASDGTEIPAGNVLLDDDDDDICIIAHQGYLGRPLPIASEDPDMGDRGFYAGAPYGTWGGGFAGVYDLTYAGRGAPFKGKCGPDADKLCAKDELALIGSMAPGASGSAMLIDGQVVGVMNLGNPRFPNMGLAVPWNILRRDLALADHRLL